MRKKVLETDLQHHSPARGLFPSLSAVFAVIRADSRLMRRVVVAVLAAMVLCAVSGQASAREPGLDEALQGFSDDSGRDGGAPALDDALEGFDDAGAAAPGTPARPSQPDVIDLAGSAALSSTSNIRQHRSSTGTDFGGLSRLRLTLDLKADAQLSAAWDASIRARGFYDGAYRISGRSHYTDQVISSMESEGELREAFLRGKVLPSLDVKLGRQIVVWGKSDNLRVTDVLNPLDNREPGMVDIEDLRLPLAMARSDWYAGRWNVTAIAIPEVRFNKNPVFGSDFYPLAAPLPQEVVPADGGGNTEYAFALNGILKGWDISFYLARIFDDRASYRIGPAGQPELVHHRLSMAGTAVNVALGNWLVRTEGAYFSGLQFPALPGRTWARSDLLAGVEYSGLTDATIAFEAVNRHLHDHDEVLAGPPDQARQDEVQAALRYQQDFLHQRLHLLLLALNWGWDGRDGALQRLSLEYELTDQVAVTGGAVNYVSGNRAEFRTIGRNDRVFLEAKYSF